METREYAVPGSCGDGELPQGGRAPEYSYDCMGRNDLFRSAMVSISVRKERYSYDIIRETGEFVINLTTKDLTWAADYCGVKSGRDVDKYKNAAPDSVGVKDRFCSGHRREPGEY